MLKRLYVDNYKCLVNFDFQPERIQLLLGLNGSGKSTVFEVLLTIRRFLAGGTTTDLFRPGTLTRWQERKIQTFEMEVQAPAGPAQGGEFSYKLEVEQSPETRQSRVQTEELNLNGKPLFKSHLGEVQLYRDNHSEGPSLGLDWRQSGVGSLAARHDNKKLTWFKEWVSSIRIVQMDPFSMTSSTEREQSQPALDLSNFASWYRHLSLERQDAISNLRAPLSEIIEGFVGLKLAPAGEGVYTLKAAMQVDGDSASTGGKVTEYTFEELSHGQRALIALYTLLHAALNSPGSLTCLDEPDNFVALAEIQPWLLSAKEAVESNNSQLLVISQHPELIDQLARDHGILFSRRQGGPSRIRRFEVEKQVKLTSSEFFARGWEDE